MHSTILRLTGVVVALCLPLSPAPAAAQMLGQAVTQMAGPFAGRVAPNGAQMAPLYGSQAGAAPHLLQGTMALAQNPGAAGNAGMAAAGANVAGAAQPGMDMQTRTERREQTDAPDADLGGSTVELLVGACAGGAFIGGFSAATAVIPAGVALAAAPVVASAMAIGCGVGVATATVSLGAVAGWRRATR